MRTGREAQVGVIHDTERVVCAVKQGHRNVL
jgi:hypothetical protein